MELHCMSLSGHQLPLLQPLLKWRQPKAGEWRCTDSDLLLTNPRSDIRGRSTIASNYFHCIDMHCMRGHCLKREPQLLHCIELFLLHCNALHARAIGVEASNGGGEVGPMQWVKRGEGASSIRTRVSLIGGGMSPACATHTALTLLYTWKHTICLHM